MRRHAHERRAGGMGNGARIIVGVIWLGGAAFNALVTTRMADPYAWLRESPIPLHRWFFRDVVSVRPVVWTVLLALGEAVLGVLTLAGGRFARLGLAGGALFSAFLFSLGTVYTLIMGPYAWFLAVLARREFSHSALHRTARAVRRR